MIRDLTDTREQVELEYDSGNGETYTSTEDRSLDPDVLILDSRGRQIAKGVMPFG